MYACQAKSEKSESGDQSLSGPASSTYWRLPAHGVQEVPAEEHEAARGKQDEAGGEAADHAAWRGEDRAQAERDGDECDEQPAIDVGAVAYDVEG